MRVRRVVIPTLTLVCMLAQANPAFAMSSEDIAGLVSSSPTVSIEMVEQATEPMVYAANSVVFTDLAGYDWAKDAINAMASKGIIAGVGDNKFAPASNVKLVEFAAMAMRAFGGEDASTTIASEQGNLNEIASQNGSSYWGNSVICAAQKYGLTEKFGTTKEVWEDSASRAEMAYIVMSLAEQMGDEQFSITDGIENNIGDYDKVRSYGNYMSYILKAYSNGILCGVNNNGDYAPDAYAKRAEAAAIIQRLVDPSKRIEVTIKEAPPVTPPTIQEGDNIGKSGVVYPKEGDIGPNGQPITRDKITGVLGFGENTGQKGGIYLGLKSPINGAEIKVGSTAPDSYDNMGGDYIEKNGYVYWYDEWVKIDNTAYAKLGKEHPASNSGIGTKADIYGNITSNSSEAMWEVKSVAGMAMWQPIYHG